VGKSKTAERTPCAPARVVQIERTTLEPFRPSTEGCARRHIRDLQLQDFRGGRSADEQNELDNLKTLYPDLPLDPDDSFTEAIEARCRVDPKENRSIQVRELSLLHVTLSPSKFLAPDLIAFPTASCR
jgi:hypothetical protein